MRKQESCLEKEITIGTLANQDVDRTARGEVNQNDRNKWRKYVHGVTNRRRLKNRTEPSIAGVDSRHQQRVDQTGHVH